MSHLYPCSFRNTCLLPPWFLILVNNIQLGSRFWTPRATEGLRQTCGWSTESSKRLSSFKSDMRSQAGLKRQTMHPENSEVAKRLGTARGKWQASSLASFGLNPTVRSSHEEHRELKKRLNWSRDEGVTTCAQKMGGNEMEGKLHL